MKTFTLLALLLAVSASITSFAEEASDVVVLTSSNFEEFTAKNPISLIEFYAPWCGHCKNLAPHYEQAATRLKAAGSIALAKVDATVETELASKFEIRGYPTIKLFKNGEASEYTGGRTADTIVEWVESATGPAVVVVDEEDVKTPESGVLFVARVKSDSSDAFKMYEKVAESLRLSAKFTVVYSDSAADEVSVHRPDEEVVTTKIGSDEAALSKFVSEERFPFFGPIDAENYAAYETREHEIVWFAGSSDDFKTYGKGIREAASKLRDTYSFVWLDTGRFSSHAENGLGISNLPGMVLRLKEGGRFMYPADNKFEAKSVLKFFDDIAAGKIERFLKSEPIPETNDDPVKVVVGKNFEDIVMAKDKDVLLEVYAPWCGHCKRLEPIYNELAEKVAEVTKDIVIAKMDGTANEPPVSDFDIRGFPTIFFVKAGETTPMSFSGDRTFEGFVSFLKQNASKPFSLESASSSEEASKDEL